MYSCVRLQHRDLQGTCLTGVIRGMTPEPDLNFIRKRVYDYADINRVKELTEQD